MQCYQRTVNLTYSFITVSLSPYAAQHCYSVTRWFGVTLCVNCVSFNLHITLHINGQVGLVHEAKNGKLFPLTGPFILVDYLFYYFIDINDDHYH